MRCKCSQCFGAAVCDGADRRSSTGQVAIHAVLLPETYKILLAGRNLPKSGPKSIPERGVGGNVSTVYDVKTGTYVVTPNYETVFCTAHTVMSDGVVVLAGGDMGEWAAQAGWCRYVDMLQHVSV